MITESELELDLSMLEPVIPQDKNGVYWPVGLSQEMAEGLAAYYRYPHLYRSLGMNVRSVVDRVEAGVRSQPRRYAVFIEPQTGGTPPQAVVFERVPGPALPDGV